MSTLIGTSAEAKAVSELAAMHAAIHAAIRGFGSDWSALEEWARQMRELAGATASPSSRSVRA